MTTTTGRTADPASPHGYDPAEGRRDIGGPGAERELPHDRELPRRDRELPHDRELPPQDQTPLVQEAPGAPEDEAPARLGERISDGPGGAIAAGEPDLLPNVETPDSPM